MRLALPLAALLAVSGLTALPATAKPAPKPVCNLVVDDPDDATPSAAVPSDPSVDIVGGDFASNGRKLTGIIRLKGLVNPNPQAPFGQAYYVLFNVKGSADTLTLFAGLFPTGNQFGYGYQGIDPQSGVNTSYTLGNAVGAIKGNEIRITADIAKFPQKAFLKNGGQVVTLAADARRVYGQRVVPSQQVGPARAPLGGLTLTLDEADGRKYTLGARSCVKIG